MNDFFEAISSNPILLSSLIAALLASIASGVMGSYVVVKRIVFLSGSISHSVLGGIGLSLYLERVHGIVWLNPLNGALIAAILSALLMGYIHLHYKEREDSVIAALWSVGMAVGILFISQTPGSNAELSNYLVGNILWITPSDLYTLFILDLIILGFVLLFHKKFLALCFDENQARLQGLNVHGLYLLLLSLIAITIVLLLQIVGVILVMAMLTIPPAISNQFSTRLSFMMFLSCLFSAAFCLMGNFIAFDRDWPIGATIALVSGIAYFLTLPLKSFWNRGFKMKELVQGGMLKGHFPVVKE